jgi:hypothetical protein
MNFTHERTAPNPAAHRHPVIRDECFQLAIDGKEED